VFVTSPSASLHLYLSLHDALPISKRLMDTLYDCADRHAAFGMCLRIEEHFGVPDVLLLRPRQISPREIVEIPIPNEHAAALVIRSEEHTSELQSRGHLVCRLLLEK